MNLLVIVIAVIIGAILIGFVSSAVYIVVIIIGIALVVMFIRGYVPDSAVPETPVEKFTTMAGMPGVNFDDLATFNFDFNFGDDPNYIDEPDGCVPFRSKPYGNIDEYDEYEQWNNGQTPPRIIDVASDPDTMKLCVRLGTYRNCWDDGIPFQGIPSSYFH